MAELTESIGPLNLFSGRGIPGVKRSGGYVYEEWLKELALHKGLRLYREMGDNDPLISGFLLLVGGLYRTMDWTAEPFDPEAQEDLDAAEFLGEEMDALEPTIPELMGEIADQFQFGFAVAEMIFKRRPDNRIGWKEWRFLAPETRDRWVFDEKTGEAVAFVQTPPPDYQERVIPLAKCIHLRTTRRKGNPEGRSILRGAYRSYYYKTKLEEIEAIGCERDLAGLPMMKIPLRYMLPDAPPEDKALYEVAKQLVRNVRRDEHEGVVIPSDVFADSKVPMLDFSLVSTGGSRSLDIGKVIERYDARIAMAMLADFMLLGHQQVGTFSLSSDKTSLFTVVAGGYADALAAELTRQAGRRLLDLNGFKGRAWIKHGDFEKEDINAFTTSLERMTRAGIIGAGDPALDAYVREMMNLPEPDEEWLAVEEERNERQLEQERLALEAMNDPNAGGQTPSDRGSVPGGPGRSGAGE